MSTSPLPVVPRWRSLSNAFRILKNPIPVFHEYISQYGATFRVYIAGVTPAIFSADPAFAQYVLQKNHKNYQKSAIQKEAIGKYVGKGLLTTDGAYWLQQRRLIQPGFHREKLVAITGIMNDVINRYLDQLEQRVSENPVVDIYQETLEVAHRIIVRSLFSDNLEEKEMAQLGENITKVQAFLIRQLRLPFLDFWFGLSGQKEKYLSIARESDEIILRYIEQRRSGGKTHDDLLQMLMETRYEDSGEGMSDQQLLDESLILFLAGHETSANAMAWMIYLLATNADAKANLVNNNAPGYAKLVVNETLRLYPPAWITDRMSIHEDHFQGVPIDEGMITIPYIYGIHHSRELWSNPETFEPERFESGKLPHPFAFLPFGGGPRQCIGNNFALSEMEMFLMKFIERFDFQLVEGQAIEMQPMVTLRPRNGILIKLKARSAS